VTRIFCTGGSTTYGRPYDDATSFCGWLRELLPVADPSRDWELINAGGISYASYRVAALMEELAAYQPDLFIVYCGHNEFLERRTYSGIIETPAPARDVTAVLSRTRTFSAMERLARRIRERPDAADRQAGQLADEVDAILDRSVGPTDYQRDPEMREQVLAHYRFNMARLVRIARACGAEVILVTPASNLRHCSPFKSQHRDGLDEEQKRRWDALWQSAQVGIEAKQFAAALRDLDRAAEIDDRFAHLHYLRGRVLDALGRHEDAKASYQRALDEDVCPLRALSPMRDIVTGVARELGVPLVDFAALVEAGSPQGIPGEELFLDHVHPTIDGHRMLALAIIDEMARRELLTPDGGWDEAAVERVASGIMGNVDRKAQGVAMRNLSKVFAWAGKMEEAYAAARKALELYPDDAETHYQVGNLARQLGRTDEALERLGYLVGVELKPDVSFYLKAHAQLAGILAERGDYAECERVLGKLLQLDPDNAVGRRQWLELLSLQGGQLIRDGRHAEAAAKLGELVRLEPDNFDARLQLAVALVRAGDHQAAAPVLEAMIAARPDYLPAYDNLSYVLAQLGRLDEAEEVCRRALAIDPDHESARRNLQLILRKKSGG
jgi:tetratricopeptide (TPR) repeat protein